MKNILKTFLITILACFVVFTIAGSFAVAQEAEAVEEEFVDESVEQFESDYEQRILGFDIAGFKIGMTPKVVKKNAKKKKYRIIDIKYSVPEFFRYNYDSKCRARNLFKPAEIKPCIEGFAKAEKVHYLEKLTLEKIDSKEKLDVYFTSKFLKNIIYKIEYQNDLTKLAGLGKHFRYQREENRRTFWYKVLQKYGEPNEEPNIWRYDVNDPNSITLIAGYDGLLLEGKGMKKNDDYEALKKARERFPSRKFTF